MQHGWGPATVPISLMSDSYKASHYLQYPGTTKMVAVGGTHALDIMCHSSFANESVSLIRPAGQPCACRWTAVWGISRRL